MHALVSVTPFDGFWSWVPVDLQIDDVSKSIGMLGRQVVKNYRCNVTIRNTVGQVIVEFRWYWISSVWILLPHIIRKINIIRRIGRWHKSKTRTQPLFLILVWIISRSSKAPSAPVATLFSAQNDSKIRGLTVCQSMFYFCESWCRQPASKGLHRPSCWSCTYVHMCKVPQRNSKQNALTSI